MLAVSMFFIFQTTFGSLDSSDFNSLMIESQRHLNNAMEGVENGQYMSGAKDSFRSSMDSLSNASKECTTTLQIDSVTDLLHNSYLAFLKKRHGIQRPLISDNYWEISTNTSRWGSHNLHDPSVIKTKGYFYVYGTDAAWATSVKGIPYRRSRDLVNWEYLGTAFNNKYPTVCNTWIDSLSGSTGHTQTGIWAPYIMKVGEEYRLYYCSIHQLNGVDNGAVICLAVSSHPKGPWTQRGPIVFYKNNAGIKTNAIDPTVTIGQDGKFWMAWGSWSQGIFMVELDPSTGLKKTGATEFVIARNRGTSWSTMEGPEIIYNPVFKKYYLFLAEGDLGTIYQTRVARSNNPNGPYTDINNASVIYTSNKDVYPLLSYAYQFSNHPGWQGVAHCGVINFNGTFYMLNQGRPTSIPSMMDMHVKKIYWTENGWPVISPERYANPGVMPAITSDLIAGTWEEIFLNEIKSNGVSNDLPSDAIKADPSQFLCKPTTLVFSSGGTISPSGSWSYDGNYLTITKGSYTYKVSLDWEWDWENGCETLIYTGLRNDGHSIWGKKSCYLNREEINMIANPSFDQNLQGFDKFNASGNVTVSITDSSSGFGNYIKGKTFSAQINTQATNSWDQSICWRFPAQKGSRYKVNFKYKVDTNSPFNLELQETAKDYTALYRDTINLSGSSTFQFITNDVSVTDPFYTLNLQYGSSTKGARLLLDDISIYDITGQWDGNYATNGDFECGSDSWSNRIFSSAVSIAVTDTGLINGEKSLRFKNTSSTTVNRLANCWYWNAYLQGGWKYRVEFDVKGTGSIDAFCRTTSSFTTATVNDISGIYGVELNGQIQKMSFDIPVLTANNGYSIGFSPQNVSDFVLDNVRLFIYNPTVGTEPVLIHDNADAGIFPNPSDGIINLSESFIGGRLEIHDLQGRLCFTSPVTSTQMNISSLGKGLFLVRINSNDRTFHDKLLIH
jgi:arabinan endo-1,5-alpha-L-arabinosidase